MEVDPPPEVNTEVDPPEVNMEVDPLEVNMEVDTLEVNMEVDPLEVNMEVDLPGSEHRSGPPPPRSGCRRGGGRGPAEKYCWASGRYALEKRLSCYSELQCLNINRLLY